MMARHLIQERFGEPLIPPSSRGSFLKLNGVLTNEHSTDFGTFVVADSSNPQPNWAVVFHPCTAMDV